MKFETGSKKTAEIVGAVCQKCDDHRTNTNCWICHDGKWGSLDDEDRLQFTKCRM